MLNIKEVSHLSKVLREPTDHIQAVLNDPDRFYERLLLRDPSGRTKDRTVLNVRGTLRSFQTRIQQLLVRKCRPSPFSHGSVKGRSIKTNCEQHLKSTYLLKTDISNFYPSVGYQQVYDLFVGKLECSPDVARLCTRICTYDRHLALGLPTSPMIADIIMRDADHRISRMCRAERLRYTRYVDDIAISGPFDLSRSGFKILVGRILRDNGFRMNSDKSQYGRLDDGITITGVRILKNHFDVEEAYIAEVHRQLVDALSLANGGEFQGPFFASGQIRGRVNFVCWVNPKRKSKLQRKFNAIAWRRHAKAAILRGYTPEKKILERIKALSG